MITDTLVGSPSTPARARRGAPSRLAHRKASTAPPNPHEFTSSKHEHTIQAARASVSRVAAAAMGPHVYSDGGEGGGAIVAISEIEGGELSPPLKAPHWPAMMRLMMRRTVAQPPHLRAKKTRSA